MQLFCADSLSTILEAAFDQAAVELNRSSREVLSNPALAGMIERLWSKYRLSVPHLHSDQKAGSRRVIRRPARDDYGHHIQQEVTMLEVSVPFTGSSKGFGYTPSRCAVISEDFGVASNHLVYSMPLNPSLEPQLNKLLERVQGNLEAARAEIETFSKTAITRLSDIAGARLKKLEKEIETASGFSFKVD